MKGGKERGRRARERGSEGGRGRDEWREVGGKRRRSPI